MIRLMNAHGAVEGSIGQPLAVIVADGERRLVHANAAFETIFGYGPREVAGMPARTLYASGEDHDAVGRDRLGPDRARDGESFQVRYRRRDGTTFLGSTMVIPLSDTDDRRTGIVAVVRDVTEQARREAAFRSLQRIVSDRTMDPAAKASAILAFGCEYFALPFGIISRIERGVYTVVHGHSPGGEIARGMTFDVDGTYCERVLRSGEPVAFHHAAMSAFADHPCYKAMGLETYVGAPVYSGERRCGTINFSSPDPRDRPFDESDMEMARLFAGWATDQVTFERSLDHLEQARRRAEEASASKTRFLANMSHEIRTPMTGMLGYADLMLGTELTGEQRRCATRIKSSGQTLLGILNDILDLSRMEAGRLPIESRPVSLAALLGDCEELLAPVAEEKGIALSAALADDLPSAMLGDPLRMRQVLLNLLGNALKFTEAGSVTLTCRREDANLRIEVRDSGIGIAPSRLREVMRDFVQADDSTQRRYGGSGLGLAISRKLTTLMGGRLHLESEEGHGTTAVLVLPLREAPMPETESATPVAPAPARERRILLAEDVAFNREMFVAMLESLGYAVEAAGDGREALELARGGGFHLAFMDVQMPDMDGLAASRAIRALPGWDVVPIVALSAGAFPDEIAACLEAGMDDHLAKPATLDALREKAAHWLSTGRHPDAIDDTGETAAIPGEGGEEDPDADEGGDGDEEGDAGTLALAPYLAALPEAQRARLLGRFHDMAAASARELAELTAPGCAPKVALEGIAALAHRIKGSAGMVGLDRLVALAEEAEASALDGAEEGRGAIDAARLAPFARALDRAVRLSAA